jgi:mono/diheme cytochrome c family protein/uncharacterized membrane protein
MRTMRARNLFIGCIVFVSLCGASGAEELDPMQLQTRVRSIFVVKCSECHGRGLSRPRAALYLNELGPLATNREWVVPHEPEKSYLWTLIRDDDMPAKGAKAGPLNAEEKQIVRAWIKAGAPASPSSAAAANAATDAVAKSPAIALPSMTTFLFALFGKFHVLVIHFPIALLAAAALAETIAVWQDSWIPSPTVRFCVLFGAASAVAAVALGWLHADVGGFGSASARFLAIHRWLGSAMGLLAIATLLSSERDHSRGRRSVLFRILLCISACLVGATAHFGGLMVHGNGFFEM